MKTRSARGEPIPYSQIHPTPNAHDRAMHGIKEESLLPSITATHQFTTSVEPPESPLSRGTLAERHREGHERSRRKLGSRYASCPKKGRRGDGEVSRKEAPGSVMETATADSHLLSLGTCAPVQFPCSAAKRSHACSTFAPAASYPSTQPSPGRAVPPTYATARPPNLAAGDPYDKRPPIPEHFSTAHTPAPTPPPKSRALGDCRPVTNAGRTASSLLVAVAILLLTLNIMQTWRGIGPRPVDGVGLEPQRPP